MLSKSTDINLCKKQPNFPNQPIALYNPIGLDFYISQQQWKNM
jgi:hypothetical protein